MIFRSDDQCRCRHFIDTQTASGIKSVKSEQFGITRPTLSCPLSFDIGANRLLPVSASQKVSLDFGFSHKNFRGDLEDIKDI